MSATCGGPGLEAGRAKENKDQTLDKKLKTRVRVWTRSEGSGLEAEQEWRAKIGDCTINGGQRVETECRVQDLD